MVVVKIELWPLGDEDFKKSLGEVHIINDGTGTRTRGNYKVNFFNRAGRYFKSKKIENHPRQATSTWNLLAKVFGN